MPQFHFCRHSRRRFHRIRDSHRTMRTAYLGLDTGQKYLLFQDNTETEQSQFPRCSRQRCANSAGIRLYLVEYHVGRDTSFECRSSIASETGCPSSLEGSSGFNPCPPPRLAGARWRLQLLRKRLAECREPRPRTCCP
jgi:hypothetical protein